ncbi:MAG: discoidin domain-containing protein [Ktedonobacteraceae bacterium]|nr:discoidin domain-containing protein [Ktedonobacteraceae bacterium]
MIQIPANLTNLALKQPATASSYWDNNHKPEFGNDGNRDTEWWPKYRNDVVPPGVQVQPGYVYPISWWQVDLGSTCQIWSIELVTRRQYDHPWCRYNFAIWASNDQDMSNSSVLGGVGSDDLVQFQGTFVLNLTNSVNARYIRATKLVREIVDEVDFGIADFRVWGSKG